MRKALDVIAHQAAAMVLREVRGLQFQLINLKLLGYDALGAAGHSPMPCRARTEES